MVMKAYMSPPLWLAIGFLTGWIHREPTIPNIFVLILWGFALCGMVVWILRDIETPPKITEE